MASKGGKKEKRMRENRSESQSGCVQILDTKTCPAQKAENTDSRTNYAVKYATARGHLDAGLA